MSVQTTFWEIIKEFLRSFFGVAGRISAQALLSWLLYIPFTVLFLISPENWGHNESLLALKEIAKLIVVSISVFLVAKLIDEIEPKDFGLKRDRWAFFDFFVGILITFFVLGLNLGYIQITGFAWESQTNLSVLLYTLGTFLIFAFVGWSEELLSRGFHLQTIEKAFSKFLGVVLSSLIFSYLHRNNPDMTLASLIFIFFGGLVFAYAYLKTNQLWLSIGLHTGWDFFLVVAFFGIPVGNLRIFHLINYTNTPNYHVGQVIFIYAMQYFALMMCALLIHKYSNMRNTKMQLATPSPGK